MGRLTDSLLVVDAHCDTLIRRQNKSDPVDLTPADPSYQIDLPRLRAGGVDCLFCMVGDRDLDASVSLIDAVYWMCGDPDGEYALCRSAGDVRRCAGCRQGRDRDDDRRTGHVPRTARASAHLAPAGRTARQPDAR